MEEPIPREEAVSPSLEEEEPIAREEGYIMEPTEARPTALQVDGSRVAPAEGEMERELFAAIRAKNKDRVRELLEMGADVNAYEPAEVRARDLRCVSLSPGPDRASI